MPSIPKNVKNKDFLMCIKIFFVVVVKSVSVYLWSWEPWQSYGRQPGYETHCDPAQGRPDRHCCCSSRAPSARAWSSCSERFCSTNLCSGREPGWGQNLRLKGNGGCSNNTNKITANKKIWGADRFERKRKKWKCNAYKTTSHPL